MRRDVHTATLPDGLCWGWWAWRAWHVGGFDAAGGSGNQI